jgi:hypothetical protein
MPDPSKTDVTPVDPTSRDGGVGAIDIRGMDLSQDLRTVAEIRDSGLVVSIAKDVLGDGYRLAEKEKLVGVPFFILAARFTIDQATLREFVSIKVLTEKTEERFVVNDGGTGIFDQMKDRENKGIPLPIYCENGLRQSDYVFEHEDGTKSPATTFYLD